jgi:hypothetical protein
MPGKRHHARDATEHAMPSSSVATEGAAGADEELQEMLLTPAAQRTEEIWIGPCKLLCMTHDIRMLSRMQDEIRSRFRVPVALEQLLHTYKCNQCNQYQWPENRNKKTKARAGATSSNQYHDAPQLSRKQLMLQSTTNCRASLTKFATTRSPSQTGRQRTAHAPTYLHSCTNS